MVEYKAGYFAISCGPRASHSVNLNFKAERDTKVKENKDAVRANQKESGSFASGLSNSLNYKSDHLS